MAKRTKSNSYLKKQNKQYINKKHNKKNIFSNQKEQVTYKDYVNAIKSSKKYEESVNYLSLFASSLEEGEDTSWKFKSNLNTFIKKHILIKE